MAGGRNTAGNNSAPNNMPPHLANQYSNNPRRNNAGAAPTNNNAPPGAAPQQTPAPQQQQQPKKDGKGVQEGQMVKMLATIEATTVSYVASTQLLTFYLTSTCPSLTYEIHTGVKEVVMGGCVSYLPNKPKMEPTRIALDGPQENKKITLKLDVSKLDEKEKNYNKHYPKQMPCVIVIRYRTTELRKKEEGNTTSGNYTKNNEDGEEIVVEQTEHTAIDLAENPKRRVISQIVTASGNAYVVENLYGIDSDNPAGQGGDGVMVGSTIVPHEGEDNEDGLCVICLTNDKDTAVMPCRHMCMCKECGEELLKHKPVCPVCRAPISTLLHMPKK
ncbi:hypothetical protein AGDE_00051 [Angomonas deanei]|uniref:Zinc finger, C3HC4 type (RING finger)/Ring finger domain/Prokaryotic RING finger family 4, putative n=1 Tax=Angomonas deanei TaxID=59799 RepID=A0A7G2CSW6_9TRYP|nr:hypothetical protein AGDE_00051 [Angomonas deanei]CAD2222317.1 Zinc finger, C3HC4 type (RING finger)/Ring finger domain/Prokaryotic RING finger family 4, putative [Angomonas deanei]|eukprot:EPY43869.1 hypothetical protein AGDE_00051 [Angomonas deanei]